jgi:hypothetical protein
LPKHWRKLKAGTRLTQRAAAREHSLAGPVRSPAASLREELAGATRFAEAPGPEQ